MTTSYLDYDGLETLVGEIKDWTAPRGLYLQGELAIYGSSGETDFASGIADLTMSGYAYGDPFVETGGQEEITEGYSAVPITESGAYLVRATISNSISDQMLAFGTSDGTYDYESFTSIRHITGDNTLSCTFVAEIEAGQYIAIYALEEADESSYTGTPAILDCLLEVERLGDEIETARIYRSGDSSTAGGGTTGM